MVESENLHSNYVGYTYRYASLNRTSLIYHFFINVNEINLVKSYKVLDYGLKMSDRSIRVNVSCGVVHDSPNEKVDHKKHLVYDSLVSYVLHIQWTPENKCKYSEAANAALTKIEIPDYCTACCDKCCDIEHSS